VERYQSRLPALLQDFEQPRAEHILAVG